MTHRSENLQASLFEAERPCVELRAAQKSEAGDGHRGAVARDRGGAGKGVKWGTAAMTKITAEHLARSVCVSTSGNRQQTSSRTIMRAGGANTASSIAPSSLAGAASMSSTTTSAAPVVASHVPASSGCSQRSATAVLAAVLAIEASRLARNGRDWHTLIEFCGLVGTLIVDEDGILRSSSSQ